MLQSTPQHANPCDADLTFLPSVVDRINDDPGQRARLLRHAATALRRALRTEHIRGSAHKIPPEAVALCAVAHLTNTSIEAVHAHYVAACESEGSSLIKLAQLERVYHNRWGRILHNLKLPASTPCLMSDTNTPPTPQDVEKNCALLMPPAPKMSHASLSGVVELESKSMSEPKSSSEGLFADFCIYLVPSPLFPRKSATTLLTRVTENGGEAYIMQSGTAGLNEVRSATTAVDDSCEAHNENPIGGYRTPKRLHKNGSTTPPRVIVITDSALAKRRADILSHLDLLSPRWLTDSLRAARVKPPSLYGVTPKAPPPTPVPLTAPGSTLTRATTPILTSIVTSKRVHSYHDLSDFRAECNLQSSLDNEATPGEQSKRRCLEAKLAVSITHKTTMSTHPFLTPRRPSQDEIIDHDKNEIDISSTNQESVIAGRIDEKKWGIEREVAEQKSPTVARQLRFSEKPLITPSPAPGKAPLPTQRGMRRSGPKWACELRTGMVQSDFPTNNHICELLSIVQAHCDAKRETFRAIGYQRAIARLRTLEYEVLSADDVRRLEDEPYIGKGMATKIWEIVTTGRLQQAEAVLQDGNYVALQALCGVWGVGPVKAMSLIAAGIQNIDELRAAVKVDPGLLDRCQTIGMHRYEDLLQRMPRSYVAELEVYVRRIVKSVDAAVDITVAGSYLRGKPMCGDVDILVYGDRRRVHNALPKIRDVMRKGGVITDDLVEGDGKYFGVFRLPGRPHGRLDLFAVPREQYPFALLTYTGSAVFNRYVKFWLCHFLASTGLSIEAFLC